MTVLDPDRFKEVALQRRAAFATAEPFPHVVLDDFLPVATANKVLAEFINTKDGWNHYHHYNERKLGLTNVGLMGPTTRDLFEVLQSRRFIDAIETLTGIRHLIADPALDGGGLHQTMPGGFLNIHTDFLVHNRHRHWSRQVNLLIYLNKGWQAEWNGNLDIWDAQMTRCVNSVLPAFNRCVIFHTQRGSFHGHPHKLACPPGESRKSIILYYYRDEDKVRRLEPTLYMPMPDDPVLKKIMVWADGKVIRAYSFLKRYFGLTDRIADRFLRRF